MIEIAGLTKAYQGTPVLDHVDFLAPAGRVTGLVGPNGAGKSTILRLLLGLESPDSGSALVNGRPYAQLAYPAQQVGALLDAGWAHPGRTAETHLRTLALLAGVPRCRVSEVLAYVELHEARRKRIGTLSLGMRQRLGLAAALLGDPRILILDEPTNGLDPTGIRWLRTALRRLRDDGATVLLSSHLLSELEHIADRVVVLNRGRVLIDSGLTTLLAQHATHSYRIAVQRREQCSAVLRSMGADVSDASDGSNALIVSGIDIERLSNLLAEHDFRPLELTPITHSLDDIYAALLANGDETGEQRAPLSTEMPL